MNTKSASANCGTWVNPTGVTGGTITVNGPVTIMTNHSGTTGLTLTGPITGGTGTPSLTIKGSIYGTSGTTTNGIGTVNLVNSGAASTFGNVAVGDSVTTGSLGGILTASSQNAMGAGTYTINYGGSFSTVTTAFNPTNAITVNNGGTLSLRGAATPGGLVTLNSGSIIAANTGTLTFTSGTNLSVPTAGVLFNNSSAGVTLTNAYPAFTGTMAFGGSGTGILTTAANTTTSGAQTLIFNQTSAGGIQLNGLVLGGNLTLTGGGNIGVTGTIAISDKLKGSIVGLVSQDATPRTVNINMAPTGVVAINTGSTFSGGLNINSGVLNVLYPSGKVFTNLSAINLNGGTFRVFADNGVNQALSDDFTVSANGGTIEGMHVNNGQRLYTFSGAISGGGPLVVRYGGTGTNGASLVMAPTAPSSYSGGITLATSNGRGGVQFNANSLSAIAAGGITVPAGTAFGVDSIATLTGNIGKFTLDTESILTLDGITAGDLDLSATTGINRDIRLGSSVSATYSGTRTLKPFGNTYKFSPGGGQILINVTNYLTGANNLDVSAGAIAKGAYGAASNTFASNNAQDYTGTTTVRGTINNSLVGVGTTGATLNIANIFSAAGATSVTRGATLQLIGTSGKLSGTSGITVHGGGIFQDGDGTTAANNNGISDRINSAANLTLGGAEGGGTFRMAFPAAANTHAQTLGTLTVNGGISTLNTTNTAAGTLNLTFAGGAGGYVRTAGGRVNLSTAAGFNVAFTSAPTGTSIASNGANPILIGATIGADFVAAAAGNWTPATYTAQNTATSWTTAGNDGNINTTGAVTGTVPSGTINSLRIAADTGANITIGTGNTLTIASGMINAATLTSARSITGGSITSGNGQDLFLMNNSSQTLTIASVITGGLAVVRTGGNTVALTNAGNAIGDVYALTGGFLQISATGALPLTTTRTIYIQGGSGAAGLLMSAGGTFTSATSINVSPLGGNINTNANGALAFEGNVTMNGALGIASPSGGNPTALTFSGNISGPGMLGLGKQSDGKNTIVVSGSNSTWSGGVRMDTTFGNSAGGNTHLRFAPSVAGHNSSGTGPIVLASGNNPGGIYFDTTAAGSTTFSNDIVNNLTVAPIVAWGLSTGLGTAGTVNTTTLSGSFTGSQGLFLQGYATSDSAISETVLSGTVSVSGAAGGFSYGTATGAQNFNNGQGGITLGVTNFRALTLQGTGNLPLVELPVGTASNGAEGFVRFAGVQSFIPGAVGPGYLSALRKSGTGNDARFGYLLTGTGGAGTSYTLPDGKSFLIGSLGAGTRVGGTLGVAGGGTATLLGGESLSGFASGDINVHANGSTDAQELTLFARDTTDRLIIGSAGNAVTFAPTTGDSGATGSITLLAGRTGTTTLLKRGVGTVEIVNAEFTGIGGTANDDRANVSWQVNEGTLAYNQTDGAVADFAGITVGLSGTLSGSGVIKGDVTSAGTIAPGNSIGILGVSDLIMSGGSTFAVEVGSLTSDSLNVTGTAALSGTGNITLALTLTVDPTDFTNFVLINNDSSDAFGFGANRFSVGGTPLNDGDSFIVTTGAFTQEFQLDYTFNGGGDGQNNDVALLAVPEPGSAALLLGGLALLASRRRRS